MKKSRSVKKLLYRSWHLLLYKNLWTFYRTHHRISNSPLGTLNDHIFKIKMYNYDNPLRVFISDKEFFKNQANAKIGDTCLCSRLRRCTAFILILLGFSSLFSKVEAKEIILSDNFQGVETRLPDGTYKLYPDRKIWAFTFWPGIKWPDSYGDGTNWLENNGESQTYLNPFIKKVKQVPVPLQLRYDPFTIQQDGLHIRAALLTPEQQKAYKVGGHRRFGSGMILSRTSFTYGKIRVVAKLPNARGSWPAFWLLAAKQQWPPEIDAFEAMAWGPHATEIHSGMVSKRDENQTYGDWFDVGTDISKDFHEYGLDWNEKTISASFDGRILWEKTTPESMKQDMYIILNLAVGGKWPYNELKIPPIDGTSTERLTQGADLIEAEYPAEMIVKSIRVSQ